MKKMIAITAVAFAMASGAAFAQGSGSAGRTDVNPSPVGTAITDFGDAGSGFYTDNTRSAWADEAQRTTTWQALSAEQQTSLKTACEEVPAQPSDQAELDQEFCTWVGTM